MSFKAIPCLAWQYRGAAPRRLPSESIMKATLARGRYVEPHGDLEIQVIVFPLDFDPARRARDVYTYSDTIKTTEQFFSPAA